MLCLSFLCACFVFLKASKKVIFTLNLENRVMQHFLLGRGWILFKSEHFVKGQVSSLQLAVLLPHFMISALNFIPIADTI